MVITSPELAVFMAVCIEFPGWTIISAAAPMPEINDKMRKTISKTGNLFFISDSSVHSRKLGVKSVSGAKIVLLVIHENMRSMSNECTNVKLCVCAEFIKNPE